MDQLGQMAFFTEKDRAAIVGHMKIKEAASRNIADLYRAVKAELETQGVGTEILYAKKTARTCPSNRSYVESQGASEIEADVERHSAAAPKVVPRHPIDVAVVHEDVVSASVGGDEAVRDLHAGDGSGE